MRGSVEPKELVARAPSPEATGGHLLTGGSFFHRSCPAVAVELDDLMCGLFFGQVPHAGQLLKIGVDVFGGHLQCERATPGQAVARFNGWIPLVMRPNIPL